MDLKVSSANDENEYFIPGEGINSCETQSSGERAQRKKLSRIYLQFIERWMQIERSPKQKNSFECFSGSECIIIDCKNFIIQHAFELLHSERLDRRHFKLFFLFFSFQTAASNATQVVIKNVSFGLSGNFSCEVTADSPSFSTASAQAQMTVVGELSAAQLRSFQQLIWKPFPELPESRPTLWTELDRYEPGDVLRANCTSPPSRPQAELTLTINNIVVCFPFT